jgi:plasmid stabilization system protein ParE
MTTIEWTRSAISDSRSLRDYIAKDSRAYADRFVQRIIEAVEVTAAFPLLGRKVPEANDDSIREILFHKYRIIYRVDPSRVLVLMVVHGGRDLTQLNEKPWEML